MYYKPSHERAKAVRCLNRNENHGEETRSALLVVELTRVADDAHVAINIIFCE